MCNNMINQREMTGKEQALALGAMDMVNGMAGRFVGFGVTREDLQAKGYLCLCEAAMEYDESRGVKFTTFAYSLVRKGMQRLVGQYTQGVASASSTEEELAEVASPECYEADYALASEERGREVAEAVNALTLRERKVIDALFGISEDAVEVQELSRRMGVGLDHIYKLRNRALRKMGGVLGEIDGGF